MSRPKQFFLAFSKLNMYHRSSTSPLEGVVYSRLASRECVPMPADRRTAQSFQHSTNLPAKAYYQSKLRSGGRARQKEITSEQKTVENSNPVYHPLLNQWSRGL